MMDCEQRDSDYAISKGVPELLAEFELYSELAKAAQYYPGIRSDSFQLNRKALARLAADQRANPEDIVEKDVATNTDLILCSPVRGTYVVTVSLPNEATARFSRKYKVDNALGWRVLYCADTGDNGKTYLCDSFLM